MSELRFMTAGESHGPCLTAVLEGLPAGVKVAEAQINRELFRRQQGYGRGGRMKIEQDRCDILSGVRFGETIGSPITLRVTNRDWANWQEKMAVYGEPRGESVTAPRPGHADLAGYWKYGRADIRDILERSSARETAMRVAIGALCKIFLAAAGIKIASQVVSLGDVKIDHRRVDALQIGSGEDPELNCYDAAAVTAMKKAIDCAKEEGDTLGGVFEVIVKGAPAGLGSHIQWDKRLDGALAAALMSIQAVKGVEIGLGFAAASLPGSRVHDEICLNAAGKISRSGNNAGGLEGGMTNGEPIILRAAMKPIPTLMRPLYTVDVNTKEKVSAAKERSDTCAVQAASVVGEAMTAFVLAKALLEKFGGDCLEDFLTAKENYERRLNNR